MRTDPRSNARAFASPARSRSPSTGRNRFSYTERSIAKALMDIPNAHSSLLSINNTRRRRKINKYGNQKITIDGIQFDSKHEAIRYQELKLLQRSGEISCLQRQVRYELVPEQREKSTEVYQRGAKKGLPIPGKVIEKPVVYIADFVYVDKNGDTVVEDTKSTATKTKDYVIKRKLMLWRHGIRVHEIEE